MACALLAAAVPATPAPAAPPGTATNIVTWHGDNLRTGWNAHERTLTPNTVSGRRFKIVATVTLDDAVYAQPLVMTSARRCGV